MKHFAPSVSSLGASRALALTSLLLVVACNDSNPAAPPPPSIKLPGEKTPTQLARDAEVPGITLEVLEVTGGTAAGGNFRSGDTVAVRFSLKKKDGTLWRIDEFANARTLLSGPTENYQRVLPEQSDVATRAVYNGDGTYTYTFATAIPDTYVAPVNDTKSFGAGDGELTGEPLRSGTYTLGLYFSWDYTVEGVAYRDSNTQTVDLLFGTATTLAAREVVSKDNCNQCHQSLRAHSGRRTEVKVCLLCHTSGSEDANNTAGTLTPGQSIDFRVLIHKLHNGSHLPSVLGVSTNEDGDRIFNAPKQPYQLAGRTSIHDYSEAAFPVWPQGLIAMPRDDGYSFLSTADKATDDRIRTGMTSCFACHGDPDGKGPLPAPKQGDLAYAQPTRRACGSCHDDVVWTRPYIANGQAMDPQLDDSECLRCHGAGKELETRKVHVHPLQDAAFNPGLNIAIQSLTDAGSTSLNGKIDPGEKIAITLKITDDTGAEVAASALASVSAVVAGPTTNSNLLLNTSIPVAALTGTQPYKVNVPQLVLLEAAGTSSATLGDEFRTVFAPHWNMNGGATTVYVNSAVGFSTVLTSEVKGPQNYIDVIDASGLLRNDYVAVDNGVTGKTEYVQIQTIEGKRLWFAATGSTTYAPGLLKDHAVGASVIKVTLTAKKSGTDYALDAQAGKITELVEFGDGKAVVVSYLTDFVLPKTYPMPINATPSLDERSGEWAGKPIVDGTHALTVWGVQNLTLSRFGETNSYRNTSVGDRFDFLVGSATTLAPYNLVADGMTSCNACHQDLLFHGGGRRGFDTCIACHSTAGAEDRPQYVAPNAPATAGVTINFREMLHKIHMGAELAKASSYQIVGFGAGTYPNNFGVSTFDAVEFPAMPGGVLNCTKCHGANNTAWLQPAERAHPTAQGKPIQSWRTTCGACHDSDAATSHIVLQTSAEGQESCAICHAKDREWHVKLMHKAR